eukprot:5557115-Alexandrium_andersonii.AAC.1
MALVLQERGPPRGQRGECPGGTGKDFPVLENNSWRTRRPANPGTRTGKGQTAPLPRLETLPTGARE